MSVECLLTEECKVFTRVCVCGSYFAFLSEDTEAVSPLTSGVQRNIVLFQGFCAMKYAVYALCVNAHKYSNCTECEPMQEQQPPEAETDQNGQTSASSEGVEVVFVSCAEVSVC